MKREYLLKKGRRALGGRVMLVAVLTIAVIGSMGLPPATASADPGVTLTLEPSSQTLSAGKTTTVDIMMNNVSNLYGAEVHLSFDETLLEVQDADATISGNQTAPSSDLFPFVTGAYYTVEDENLYYYSYSDVEGGYFIAQCEADNGLGEIDYAVTLLNPVEPNPPLAGISGSGVLATITFLCLGEGEASIDFDVVKLADADANPITVDSTSGAIITQGILPVVVVPTSPGDGVTGVARDANISVTFNRSMNTALVQAAFSTTPSLSGTFSWSDSDKIMTFDPATDFAYETTYIVTIAATAKDSIGNSLDGDEDGVAEGSPIDDYSWSFTSIGDVISPTVTTTSPASDDTDVAVDSDISVTFSEAMDTTSVEGAFSTDPSVTGSFTWSDNTMTFNPAANLAYNTPYTATIAATAMDLAENTLTAEYSWSFTTPPPPFAARVLPDMVMKGETFEVTVTFTASADVFGPLAFVDEAPTGWEEVSVDKSWCDPEADEATVEPLTPDRAEYIWYSSYDVNTPFTVVYQVTVPVDAELGTYTFDDGDIGYSIAGAPTIHAGIGGDTRVTIAAPVLSTTPEALDHDFGDVAKGQTDTWSFDITNAGILTLIWDVASNQPWLTVDPISGNTTTETDTVTVQIDTSGLTTFNSYNGTITIDSNSGTEPTRQGVISVHVTIEVVRSLPDAAVIGGSPFEVTVTFTATEDVFGPLALVDEAPTGWEAAVDTGWCGPEADEATVEPLTPNRAEYIWYGSSDNGTEFTVVYKVSVPGTVTEGTYTFDDGDVGISIAGSPKIFVAITGEFEIEAVSGTPIVGVTREAKSDILGEVTITLYKSDTVMATAVSDVDGNYEIVATEIGDYTAVASKAGFRDETQTISISVDDFGQTLTLNFQGAHGIVPNAADVWYVLDCVILWKYKPVEHPELGLDIWKILDVVIAWKYKIID